MKLVALEPRWIGPESFTFRCPHCRAVWLTCTLTKIRTREQHAMIHAAFGEDSSREVVIGCNPNQSWSSSSRDFESMTVTPSLDASAAGHWHGFITNGEIR